MWRPWPTSGCRAMEEEREVSRVITTLHWIYNIHVKCNALSRSRRKLPLELPNIFWTCDQHVPNDHAIWIGRTVVEQVATHSPTYLTSIAVNINHSSARFNLLLTDHPSYWENVHYFSEGEPESITRLEQNTSISRIIGSSKSHCRAEMNWLIPAYEALESFCSSQRVW